MAASIASRYTDFLQLFFSSPIVAKAWLATLAIVFAAFQLLTAARMWGKLKAVVPLSDATAARAHRWSGRIALLLTLPVIFHCVFILGFKTTDWRVTVHCVAGSFLYGIFAAKVVFIRNHSYPGWVLPVAGGLVAATLATLWLTSALWYFTQVKFGF